MTRDEIGNARSAVGVGLIVGFILGFLSAETGQTLVNNPCAPHWEVFSEGRLIDCTKDEHGPDYTWRQP